MNNLNPNGTGQLLPNQYTNSNLSFVPPPVGSLGPGFQDATYSSDQEAAPQNRPQIVDLGKQLGKGYEGCYWFRVVLNHSQRGYRQVGLYSKDSGKRAEGGLWSDGRGYLCLPPLTTTTSIGNAAVDRVSAATVFGVHVFTHFETGLANLYRETSGTSPVPIAVAGYAPPAGNSGINAIRSIMVNGVNYLAICFQAAGANSIQILSDLANPPTSSAIPVGAVPTYDLIQTAIDGNALLVYTTDALGNGCIKAIRTDVGAGTVVLSAARCQLTPGGYAVGLSEAEDSLPMPYWVEPQDGNFMAFNLTGAGITNRGRLIKTDARGYLPVTVDVPLRWVTYATKWRGGIVVCDTQTHWYLNKNQVYGHGGKWRRMSVFDDLPANSDKQYVCCGHHEKDGRFLVETNETITTGGTGNTQRYSIEFDYDTWEATRIEAKITVAATGIQSKGGASLPWSPFTSVKYARIATGTNYVWQRIGPLGENLFNMRKTAGAQAGTGVEYAGEESLTLPAMDIDGLEGLAKAVTCVEGPTAAAVAYGGTGAYVGVEELLSSRTGFGPNGQGQQFFGTEPAQRVQRRYYKFPMGQQPPWTYQMQFRITEVRQSGGTDPTRMTPNAYNNSIYIEGIAVRDPVNAPSAAILHMMDRQRVRPTP